MMLQLDEHLQNDQVMINLIIDLIDKYYKVKL